MKEIIIICNRFKNILICYVLDLNTDLITPIAIIDPGTSQQQTGSGCLGSLQHASPAHTPNDQPDLAGSRQQTTFDSFLR